MLIRKCGMGVREMTNPYKQAGFEDREEYLTCLAEDYGMSLENVKALADVLGPDEDFDGLVSACQDYEAEED